MSATHEPAALTDRRGSAGRPANNQPVPWRNAHTQPAGPWRPGREWMAQGACTAPEVDPAWFTVEETAPDAAQQIAHAKAICRRCPVRLWCRIHADETGEYGIYAAETHTERTRRLRRWQRLELPA